MKLLQSDGELTIASTGKDPVTGRLQTQEYKVQGPVQLMMTTTKAVLDEELLNRCLVLSVDEGKAQTEAIFRAQRRSQTLEGMLRVDRRQQVMRLHQNAQRLLRPLRVVNPFAGELTYSDTRTRARRDHGKYLTLIAATTLLFQHQRQVKKVKHGGATVSYIETTKQDMALAEQLMGKLVRKDELAPQTARLWESIQTLVRNQTEQQGVEPTDIRFSRRQVRDYTGLSATQVRVHLQRLEHLEYVLVYQGGATRRCLYGIDDAMANLSAATRPLGGAGDRQVLQSDSEALSCLGGENENARPRTAVNGASHPNVH